MARKPRRTLDDAFKVKVVLEALKEDVTLGELASKYEIHSNQINTWKKQFLANAVNVFGGNKSEKQDIEKLEEEKAALHECLGEKTMEVEFLKKNCKKLGLL